MKTQRKKPSFDHGAKRGRAGAQAKRGRPPAQRGPRKGPRKGPRSDARSDARSGPRNNPRKGPRPAVVPARDDLVLVDDMLDDDVVVGSGGEDASATQVVAPLVRLNKYLSAHGVASRRRCDELIQKGKVTVDGEPVHELGTKVDPEHQRIEIDGYVLGPARTHKRYYVLNKPGGVVCTNEERETRPRAVDLITDREKGRIYTIGRLDEESKGLILLTNDGEFANRIMHPKYGVEKTYVVKVAGRIEDEALDKIREGVHLAEGRTAGARIFVLKRGRDNSLLEITVHEGMNREIRRVFARVGYKVLDLKRTRIGPLNDRGLKVGRWRELTMPEVRDLREGKSAEPAKYRAPGSRPPRKPRTFKARRPWSTSDRAPARDSFGKERGSSRGSFDKERGSSRGSFEKKRGASRGSFEAKRGRSSGSFDSERASSRGSFDPERASSRGSFDTPRAHGKRGQPRDGRGRGKSGKGRDDRDRRPSFGAGHPLDRPRWERGAGDGLELGFEPGEKRESRESGPGESRPTAPRERRSAPSRDRGGNESRARGPRRRDGNSSAPRRFERRAPKGR